VISESGAAADKCITKRKVVIVMICCACKHEGDDFIRMYQVGVNNYVRSKEVNEPQVSFDILICTECGNLQADVNTVKTKLIKSIWDCEIRGLV